MSNKNMDEKGSTIHIGLMLSLVITLVLGSYIYTWSETGRQEEEKQKWRSEHNQVLDKRFDEINKKQDKLESLVTNSNDKTQELLKQLVEEQHKSNELIIKQKGTR